MTKKKPQLAIRPKFDPMLALVEAVLIGLTATIVGVLVGGTFLFLIVTMIGLGAFVTLTGIYTFCFILCAAAMPALYYEIKKRAFRRTAYFFFNEHLEYQDFRFYISRRRGRILYEDIYDVFERGSTLQTHRVLTTIYISVPRTQRFNQRGFPGLKIMDVPENANYAEKIINILEAPEKETPVKEEKKEAEKESVTSPPPETSAETETASQNDTTNTA